MKLAGIAAFATGVCMLGLAVPACAQERSYNIPEGNMAKALQAFGRQSGKPIIFKVDEVRNLRSPGYRGNATPQVALDAILAGSGFSARFDRGGAIAIVRTRAVGANADEALSDGDSEIIVTAQKRSQTLTDVPISLTAVPAVMIEKRGLVSFEDYLRTVPAVAYIDQGPGQNNFVIRGAYGDAFETGPTVGVYFGDVPLAGLALGATADAKLIDIERIEVLRGPQGTLYGSNSLSGAIRFIPAAPDLDRTTARLKVGYSSTAGFGGENGEVEAVVNLPIVNDRLAVRAVAYRNYRSGFVDNVAGDDPAFQASAAFFDVANLAANQRRVGDRMVEGIRASLLWQPTPDFSASLSYLLQSDRGNDRPFAQLGFPKFTRATYRFGPFVGDGDALNVKLGVANLTLDYRLPFGSLYSSTSIIDQDYRRLWDIGSFFGANGLVPPIHQDSLTNAHAITEEARFTSDFKGPFQLIAGFFYEKSRQPTPQTTYYLGDPALHPFGPNLDPNIFSLIYDARLQQTAFFGEASYELTPKLKVTVGARHFSYDSKYLTDIYQSADPAIFPVLRSDLKGGESGNTFKVQAEYKPTPQTNVYAKFSQGFRLGRPRDTISVQSLCDADKDGVIDGTQLSATDPLVGSDRIDSYELGAKGTFFGGNLALSGAVYHNSWKNIPVTFRPPTCSILSAAFNVGKVDANGFELEGNFSIARALFVDFGVGYVDSKVATTSPLGTKGDRLNYTPKWNGHIGAEYRFPFAGNEASVRADYSFYGNYYTGLGETGAKFKGYDVLDVSAGIVSGDIEVRAFADNVTNRYALKSDSFWPVNGVYPIRPRTMGIRLTARFD